MSSLIVSLSRITEIIPHPNADRLDIAKIKGWQCIVAKGQQKVGDLVVFIPPESIVPAKIIDALKLEYLRKNGRVGTVKLRGVISQGLVLLTDQLLHPELFDEVNSDLQRLVLGKNGKRQAFVEEDNLAEILGIKKYEPPEPDFGINATKRENLISLWQDYQTGELSLRRFIKKIFFLIYNSFQPKKKLNPLFDKYTDIENIKHYNTVFSNKEIVIMTEKIHGTNFRAGNLPRYATGSLFRRIWQLILTITGKKYEFVYGSHTVQKTVNNRRAGFYQGDVYGHICEKYNLKNIIPQDYIIYGEIYGTNPFGNKAPIQKNYDYGLKESVDVLFFDVKYKGKYLSYKEAVRFFQQLNLPVVPLLYYGPFSEITVKTFTEGKSVIDPSLWREGTVIRPEVESLSLCGRKILKSINPEYLLLKNNTEFH